MFLPPRHNIVKKGRLIVLSEPMKSLYGNFVYFGVHFIPLVSLRKIVQSARKTSGKNLLFMDSFWKEFGKMSRENDSRVATMADDLYKKNRKME